jgi:UDPglucose--hexose-1-phosphate uridylyltransferase
MTNKQAVIRKSFIFNKYVIIAPGRAVRGRDLREQTQNEPNPDCPFCAQNVRKKDVIDKIKIKKDTVTCIKNIFPAVSLNNKRAYGTQEVIIESENHQKGLADFSLQQIGAILKMYARRTKAIAKNKKIDYILCFKNQGSKAGASLFHAHSQIFATEIVPEDLHEEMILAQRHKIKHNRCAYCDIIKMEMKSSRHIYSDKYAVAFTPYASQFHFEAWIVPKRHTDNIADLSPVEIKSIAKILKRLALKLKQKNLSFNYFLHNVVSDKQQHFYIKVQPRDSVWAGVELGSGLVINSISPEAAAKYYRAK